MKDILKHFAESFASQEGPILAGGLMEFIVYLVIASAIASVVYHFLTAKGISDEDGDNH